MMPDIFTDFSLQDAHTFGLRARAAAFVAVQTESALLAVVSECRAKGRRFVILGEGSNTVFTGDIDACVIQINCRGIRTLEPDDSCARFAVAAGENWHEWVEWTLIHGYPGLENLALIPGSVGACPVQNIGAYGLEVMDRIESVRYLDLRSGAFEVLSAVDCEFSYRDSIFKRALAGVAVITEVVFRLPTRWQPIMDYADVKQRLADCQVSHPTPRDVFDAVVAVRTAKLPDPSVTGNAGSFFKNPLVDSATYHRLKAACPGLVSYAQPAGNWKLAAGWLIDQCGLKGFQVGGAAVSDRQALVLVNKGSACASDVARLVGHIQTTVKNRFGVDLEPEPVLVG